MDTHTYWGRGEGGNGTGEVEVGERVMILVLDMMGQYLYVCYPCKRDEREREAPQALWRRRHRG